jgi:hypothetical protein
MRMSRLIILLTALLLLPFPQARAADAGAVAEIPDVSSVEELLALKQVRVGDWGVRVAVADAGPDAGPWKLLYCYAEYAGDGEPTVTATCYTEDVRLGPLPLEISWHVRRPRTLKHDPRLVRKLETVRRRLPRRGLYCQTIPLAWKGTCYVLLRGPGDTAALERGIVVNEPQPCYWQPMARLVRLGEDAKDNVHFENHVRDECYAAFPQMNAFIDDERLHQRDPAKPTPLPGTLPAGAEWDNFGKLELSVRGGECLVRCRGTKMTNWPDSFLLARWWVNGKTLTRAYNTEAAQRLVVLGRMIRATEDETVKLHVPSCFGEVKAGDTVGLQVLYAPARFQILPEHAAEWQIDRMPYGLLAEAARLPLLSNRVEFRVTPEILSAKPEP